jgi:hypothetical protein
MELVLRARLFEVVPKGSLLSEMTLGEGIRNWKFRRGNCNAELEKWGDFCSEMGGFNAKA